MPKFYAVIKSHYGEGYITSCPAALRHPIAYEIKTGKTDTVDATEHRVARAMRDLPSSIITVVYYSKEPRQAPIEFKRESFTRGWIQAPEPIPFIRNGIKYSGFPNFKYKVNADVETITEL